MTVIAAVPYPGGVAIATDLLSLFTKDYITLKTPQEVERRDEGQKILAEGHVAVAYSGRFLRDGGESKEFFMDMLRTCSVDELLEFGLTKYSSTINNIMKENVMEKLRQHHRSPRDVREIVRSFHMKGLIAVYNGEGAVYYDNGSGTLTRLAHGGVYAGGLSKSIFVPIMPRGEAEAVYEISSMVRALNTQLPEEYSGLEAVVITAAGARRVAYEHISPQPAALIR